MINYIPTFINYYKVRHIYSSSMFRWKIREKTGCLFQYLLLIAQKLMLGGLNFQ